MDMLKLIAFDAEDLQVVSIHLQDAVLKVGDMVYQPRQKRFAALVNRFDWSVAVKAKGGLERRRCALRFERVLAARLTGIELGRPSDVLSLLAIQFETRGGEDPGGAVTLLFAGGAAICLDVECLEAELRDLGPAWRARAMPQHGTDDDA